MLDFGLKFKRAFQWLVRLFTMARPIAWKTIHKMENKLVRDGKKRFSSAHGNPFHIAHAPVGSFSISSCRAPFCVCVPCSMPITRITHGRQKQRTGTRSMSRMHGRQMWMYVMMMYTKQSCIFGDHHAQGYGDKKNTRGQGQRVDNEHQRSRSKGWGTKEQDGAKKMARTDQIIEGHTQGSITVVG